MAPPAAATESENSNVTLPLAAPPSTIDVAADNLIWDGPSTTVSVLVLTVIGLVPILVAAPLSATEMAVAPAAVPAAAVMVNEAEVVAPLATSTVVGLKVMPVAVGVRVMAPPAAATESENSNVTLPLAAPPSTIDVAADNLIWDGPSTTVSVLVLTVIGLDPILVAEPLSATEMAVAPAAVPAAAVM